MHKDLYAAARRAVDDPTRRRAKAIGLVLPELKGSSTALPSACRRERVGDRSQDRRQEGDLEGRDQRRVQACREQQLKGILAYTNDPNVSIDFNHDPHSPPST